jgi:hypothetical protein
MQIKVSHIELNKNCEMVYGVWLMALCKLGFIMDQYAWKSELLNSSWWRLLYWIITYIIYIIETVHGALGKAHLWSYINKALL